MNCLKCEKALTVYDIGFYKKLVNRGAEDCMCILCTSEHFRITEETAWNMIRRFQKTGCTLFPKTEE
ncbi:MAG: hypothetical protein J1E34_04630 [Oscillospiraceae bacterium]|nr:hypothetical protein [Oscillospiraceae bacterium]